jgi:hydroxypyruvate isomerase
LLTGLAGAAAVSALSQPQARAQQGGKAVVRGRINQSVCHWCFASHWSLEQLCRYAVELGLKSVELVAPDTWPTLKKHGLTCAIAPNGMAGPPFVKGFNNPKYHDAVIAATRSSIEACAAAGVPAVIAFTGYKWRDAEDPGSGAIAPDEGIANCVAGFKKLVGFAESRKVTLCLEMLNTRDDSHPMKGHPGYQGDHLDFCVEIINRVGSPALKLLYDIYHVQIMDGDQIRRIRRLKDLIGHVHTAGNPGRGELDDKQEINYPAILRTLAEVGYKGYVGQEFIPTREPAAGLREAVTVCDV